MFRSYIAIICIVISFSPARAETPDTVFLEELTWVEVRDAIVAGSTTVIVPTAGTEQNGPHMVLGKHKYRMNDGAERIARALGNAVVAPVMTYVPEGQITPPTGHMRYAGTISIPPEVFKSVLEFTARSLKVHGFTDILFIGDSGPNQRPMQEVAEMLNKEWASDDARVHHVSEWYRSVSTVFRQWLIDQGETEESIGTHGGLAGTSMLMAVAPQHVRNDQLAVGKGRDVDGVVGDATRANAEIGRMGIDFSFDAAMSQIKELVAKD